jgi:hypothetical protein
MSAGHRRRCPDPSDSHDCCVSGLSIKRCPQMLCASPIEALRFEMRAVLQILAKIAAVIVAAVATYFIVTFLLQFF